jgi:hypothetical protein
MKRRTTGKKAPRRKIDGKVNFSHLALYASLLLIRKTRRITAGSP